MPSKRLVCAQYGSVTDTFSSLPAGLTVGDVREENGKIYELRQTDATVSANQAVMRDTAAAASKSKVIPTAAAGDICCGVAETAIASGSFGWITIAGEVEVLLLSGVAVDDPLAPSGTAGALQPAVEAGSGDYEAVCAVALDAGDGSADTAKLLIGSR